MFVEVNMKLTFALMKCPFAPPSTRETVCVYLLVTVFGIVVEL